ncbi:4-hydroxyphenylacetate 3-hydroxylase N-terminal domain-containing protein [Geobacillus sp. WSUCF-018B]|uniref:4-hydroxyphenylacetate 3-hydroxylase N-terminal domain-containing protein n=1 Tax=Geobacillus sp. WSUCF-018B TaxID=2055939 RepID=UPI000C285074|nr:4-hydroxyphenylacetate 3-hydroxylase N-terminal domain-containing protein [Geobacillus sp. WSUCF-018B]PJW16301.1 hypothetical protein CV944_15270 [Geobacillus sp. WSUCF-018B]
MKLIHPQMNRGKALREQKDADVPLHLVERRKDGIIVSGIRLLATQGGITDEILVFPSTVKKSSSGEDPYALAFAIPNNTPGVKFICREAFDYGRSAWDHPLASRFEEGDAIVSFENVFVPCEQALDVVFGYTIVHDLSIPHKQRYRPAVKEQARDGFAPVGPWIVSHDEVGDPMALRLRTYVNGAVVQEGYTGDMIFSIPYLLEYITEFMTLAPGDVMLTGTPKGAVNVQPGDEVVTEIERIGRLVNYIA